MHPIEEARTAAGLSMAEMSRIMEIPYRTIQDWESGKRKCPPYVERLVIKELNEIREISGKGNGKKPL